jgi:hypothetical protein
VQCNYFEIGFVLVSDVINALENAVLKNALGSKCIEHLKIFIKPAQRIGHLMSQQ